MAARRSFADAPEPWIDLSTGINPVAYPAAKTTPADWQRLPERCAIARLEEIAVQAFRARSTHDIVAAPGTQALIQWLPWLFPARRVAILGFTYGEYERGYIRSGANVTTISDLGAVKDEDVVIVVNPNNPDGRLVAPAELKRLAANLAARGGTLIVDEAFMDVMPKRASLVPHLPDAGAFVLRSFGKTYGLAGLRLGFAIAPPALAARFRDAIGPWAVSGPAITIAARALSDKEWLLDTLKRLKADVDRLDRLVEECGWKVLGGTPLFRLVRTDRPGIFNRVANVGILVRPFAELPDCIRIGLPQPQDWLCVEDRIRSLRGHT